MMRVLGLALSASLLSGCALNAIFEVEMQLPYEAGQPQFAHVQITTLEPSPWHVQLGDSPRIFDLAATQPCRDGGADDCNVQFSVVTQNVDVEHLFVKVSFCESEDCSAIGGPGVPPFFSFDFEQPFHRGEVTRWTTNRPPEHFSFTLDRQPPPQGAIPMDPAVREVPRCGIAGCLNQDMLIAEPFGWCDGATGVPGQHYCEIF